MTLQQEVTAHIAAGTNGQAMVTVYPSHRAPICVVAPGMLLDPQVKSATRGVAKACGDNGQRATVASSDIEGYVIVGAASDGWDHVAIATGRIVGHSVFYEDAVTKLIAKTEKDRSLESGTPILPATGAVPAPSANKSRARIAAEVYSRDYAHLTDMTRCIVVADRGKVDQIISATGRAPCYYSWNERYYTREPITIDSDWVARCLHEAAGKNRRLNALIDLAVATGSSISFHAHKGRWEHIAVDCEVAVIEGRSPEALDAAARWMRIEHEEAVRSLMGRAQGQCPDYRLDYPADPVACIQAVQTGFVAIAHWVWRNKSEPVKPIPVGDAAVDTLEALLAQILGKRLTKGQARRLDEARAIVGRMRKAA